MATGQGKVRGNIFIFKVRFCKIDREILNTKKVRETSGYLIILVQNSLALAGILSILSD